MKLTHNGKSITIADAISVACDGCDYDQGQLEDMRHTQEKTISVLANMIEILAKKGAFTSAEMNILVGYKITVAE